jgi:hypothetical protein
VCSCWRSESSDLVAIFAAARNRLQLDQKSRPPNYIVFTVPDFTKSSRQKRQNPFSTCVAALEPPNVHYLPCAGRLLLKAAETKFFRQVASAFLISRDHISRDPCRLPFSIWIRLHQTVHTSKIDKMARTSITSSTVHRITHLLMTTSCTMRHSIHRILSSPRSFHINRSCPTPAGTRTPCSNSPVIRESTAMALHKTHIRTNRTINLLSSSSHRRTTHEPCLAHRLHLAHTPTTNSKPL